MNHDLSALLNKQVQEEFFSAYLYLSMAAFFIRGKLPGLAHYFEVQSQEEVAHAMGIYSYLLSRNQKVTLLELGKPESEFGSAGNAAEEALKHEKYITGRIKSLVALAKEKNDGAAAKFLQWYIDEQAEEEESAEKVIRKIAGAGDSAERLNEVDEELGKRTFSPPKIA